MSSSSGDGSSSDYSVPATDGSSSSSPPPPSKDGSSSSSDDSSSGNSSTKQDGKDNNDNKKDKGKSSSKSDSSSGGDSDSPPSHGDRSSGRSSPDSQMKGLPSSSSQDSHKAVVAAVASSVTLLLVILILSCICGCRKRKRSHKYSREIPHSHFHNNYGNNWHNNNRRPPFEGMARMTPPPWSGGFSSEQSWMMAPPQPMMSSSPAGSDYYSGSNGGGMAPPHPGISMGFNQGCFTYNALAAATNGFSQANLLGQGGFGYVHKGTLPNGREVAVKSLKSNSGQGEREFQAEVDIISRVHHRHLVSLVGYCIAGSQRMLVYEFVPNGTLEYHLYRADGPTMDWPTRLKIALGAAKGFAYLHEDCNPRIIHRDIKTANILLDLQYEAKVADFGLAKLSSDANTHVSTRIMGTFGYLAPEYASTGKLTEKSDVYSFGILLLEFITGRRPIDLTRDEDDETLVDWARPILTRVQEGGSFEELVDPRLGDNYDRQEMLRMAHCAAAAIRQSARRRPKMSKLVRVLEGDVSLENLNEGMKGAPGAMNLPSSGASDYDVVKTGRSGIVLSSSQELSSDEQGSEYANAANSPAPNAMASPNLARPGH